MFLFLSFQALHKGYRASNRTRDFAQHMMALQFLPHDKIPEQFNRLAATAVTAEEQMWAEYIQNTCQCEQTMTWRGGITR